MTDLLIIIGLTLASCITVGLIGFAVLHFLRYRSLRQQLTIATLLPVVAVAATVLINVQLMFLSAHDSLVILIALLTSLVLAALGAWLVVRRIARASRRVGAGLHQLVSDTASSAPVTDRTVGSRSASGTRPSAGRPGGNPANPRRIPGPPANR
jgi:hypothetical protein